MTQGQNAAGRPSTAPTVTLLVCTLNEAENIPHVLKDIPPVVSEILVVDGHSTDGTTERVRQIRPDARVVLQPGKGKGDAIRYGIREAHGDIVVTMDADGSMDAQEIPRLVQPLLDGADFVKASRFLPGGGTDDMPWHRRMANRVFTTLVNLLYGAKYSDVTYGFNAFRRRSVEGINARRDGFDELVEWLIKLRQARLRVVEVPSYERGRLSGKAKLHGLRDGARILGTILRERL